MVLGMRGVVIKSNKNAKVTSRGVEATNWQQYKEEHAQALRALQALPIKSDSNKSRG